MVSIRMGNWSVLEDTFLCSLKICFSTHTADFVLVRLETVHVMKLDYFAVKRMVKEENGMIMFIQK